MVKLEQETGMQANAIFTDGLRTFDMQYLANLLFTERSKVYKVALFSEEGMAGQRLQGWAADPQKSGKEVAQFFLERFLGCRHQNDPRELTRRFHDVAMDWVNSRFTNSDSDVRVDYVMAVMVELQSSDDTLDPATFIETHLREPHRDEFAEFLRANDVPVRSFDKNTDLIGNRLQKVRFDLASGAFLIAPLEAVQDGTVAVKDLGGGRTTVTVTDTLANTSSGAAAGRPPKSTNQPVELPSQAETIPGLESVLVAPTRALRVKTVPALPPAQM